MKIVKLKGGLGNQLFQYAFARAISSSKKREVYLDDSDYFFSNHRVKRSFDLLEFNITLRISSKLNFIHKKYIDWKIKNRLVTFVEQGIYFDENYLKRSGDFFFDGYWQSYKYFDFIRAKLQEEIVYKKKISSIAKKIQLQLKYKNTVAVHFRRGDYVSDQHTNDVHGFCTMDYYINAMTHMKTFIENPMYVIFSDEIAFVKNELGSREDFFYVDGLSSHLEEFEIMKGCNHFIIANSTFSWWAAWLSSNDEKKVIAPKKWFKNEELERQSIDLIPEDWIRI